MNTATLRMGSGALKLHIAILLLITASQHSAVAESPAVEFPIGTVVPHVTCLGDPKQSYSLYLPSSFSATHKWPIVYVFDPFARGRDATEVVRAAAEKFGYIVAASNNSKNGAMVVRKRQPKLFGRIRISACRLTQTASISPACREERESEPASHCHAVAARPASSPMLPDFPSAAHRPAT